MPTVAVDVETSERLDGLHIGDEFYDEIEERVTRTSPYDEIQEQVTSRSPPRCPRPPS